MFGAIWFLRVHNASLCHNAAAYGTGHAPTTLNTHAYNRTEETCKQQWKNTREFSSLIGRFAKCVTIHTCKWGKATDTLYGRPTF